MRTDPRVSVVLPTFERREYVCRAVRSVFAQHYSSWELIVVDDGSTDGTKEALHAFGPRLRYLWQENRGVSAARNAALRIACGEIVAFLDSDDRWLPDHLDTVVAMLDRNPEAVLASTCPHFDFAGRRHVSEARLVDVLPRQLVDNWVGYPRAPRSAGSTLSPSRDSTSACPSSRTASSSCASQAEARSASWRDEPSCGSTRADR